MENDNINKIFEELCIKFNVKKNTKMYKYIEKEFFEGITKARKSNNPKLELEKITKELLKK